MKRSIDASYPPGKWNPLSATASASNRRVSRLIASPRLPPLNGNSRELGQQVAPASVRGQVEHDDARRDLGNSTATRRSRRRTARSPNPRTRASSPPEGIRSSPSCPADFSPLTGVITRVPEVAVGRDALERRRRRPVEPGEVGDASLPRKTSKVSLNEPASSFRVTPLFTPVSDAGSPPASSCAGRLVPGVEEQTAFAVSGEREAEPTDPSDPLRLLLGSLGRGCRCRNLRLGFRLRGLGHSGNRIDSCRLLGSVDGCRGSRRNCATRCPSSPSRTR